MSKEVRNLAPSEMWNRFADLNEVPRPSKQEDRVRKFMKEFGESLNLKTIIDDIGNVIIYKPASKGYENKTPIVMQSHLDMVCQKNNDTVFDFNTEGIKMYVDGDWVKADGTTLGADNGIGVASIMAILASKTIDHPAIDALFTIDEETGMTGALGLKGGLLNGKILLNLDTEDDDELTVGCAGGVDVNISGNYALESTPANSKSYKLTVKGLSGGHSGMDIIKGLGNANKLINRLLYKGSENFGLRISMIDGGGLRNAIPRESFALISVEDTKENDFKDDLNYKIAQLKLEYNSTDPNMDIILEPVDNPGKVVDLKTQTKLINAIYACFNGIYRMSPDIEGLVQTSNNLARVLVENGKFTILCLARGSVDSEKMDVANSLRANFEQIGCQVKMDGSYPGWSPKPNAKIVKMMSKLYKEMFKEDAKVSACHAGLECGILGTNYPDMEMISFGPNIRGAHSPDEKVQISSVQKYWKFLIETLKRIE